MTFNFHVRVSHWSPNSFSLSFLLRTTPRRVFSLQPLDSTALGGRPSSLGGRPSSPSQELLTSLDFTLQNRRALPPTALAEPCLPGRCYSQGVDPASRLLPAVRRDTTTSTTTDLAAKLAFRPASTTFVSSVKEYNDDDFQTRLDLAEHQAGQPQRAQPASLGRQSSRLRCSSKHDFSRTPSSSVPYQHSQQPPYCVWVRLSRPTSCPQHNSQPRPTVCSTHSTTCSRLTVCSQQHSTKNRCTLPVLRDSHEPWPTPDGPGATSSL